MNWRKKLSYGEMIRISAYITKTPRVLKREFQAKVE